MEKEDEEEKSIKKEKLNDIKLKLIPSCQLLFDNIEQNLKNNIKKGKEKSLQLIETELNHIKLQLKKVDEDVILAANKLQNKIKKVIEEVIEKQKREIIIVINLIEKLVKEEIQTIEDKEDSSLKIETNKDFKKK